MLGLVITWSGTWLVTTGHPMDMVVLTVTVSGGPKELTGVWSVCSFDHDFLVSCISSLNARGVTTWGIKITTAQGRMKFL